MSKEYKYNNYIFGKEYSYDDINSDTIFDLITKANLRLKTLPEIELECFLEVLNKISIAWKKSDYHLRKKAIHFLLENTTFGIESINEALDYISQICSLENLINLINLQLESLETLNNGKKINLREKLNISRYVNLLKESSINQELENTKIKAIPKGIILHYNTSNLFFEAIESFVYGIITKNVNIVKVTTNENLFFFLFLESIKEIDSSGIIFNNQAIIILNDEKKELEELLLNEVSAILYNGDLEEIQSLKNKLNYNVKLIENPRKYSFALIENKYFKSNPNNILKSLAFDICKWNQKTSSSPNVIYIMDKDLRGVHQFIESLFDEMVIFCENKPNNNLSFEEKVKIRRIRELTKLKQVKSEGRLVCPEDFSFTLILEYDPKFKLSCLNRTIYIKRVSNIENLIEQLEPIREKLQTAGIYVSEKVKQETENKLISIGIKRITKLGNMSKINSILPNNGYFLLRELVDYVAIDY